MAAKQETPEEKKLRMTKDIATSAVRPNEVTQSQAYKDALATVQSDGDRTSGGKGSTAALALRSMNEAAQAGYYDKSATNTQSKTVKQNMDNILQNDTQPGITKAIDAGSASKVIKAGTESTASMLAQSDMLRESVGKGFITTPNGEVSASPGDFLPGAGARIRGEAVATPTSGEAPVFPIGAINGKWEPLAWQKDTTKKPGKPVKTTKDIYNIMGSKNL